MTSEPSPLKSSHAPGQTADCDGLYVMLHAESHKESEPKLFKKGDVFPPHSCCSVEYLLIQTAPNIDSDPDFSSESVDRLGQIVRSLKK